MNKRKQLLSALANMGYKGPEVAEDIIKYLADNSIELKGADGNAYDIAAILKAKTVVIDDAEAEDADYTEAGTKAKEIEDESVSKKSVEKKKAAKITADDDGIRHSPAAWARNAERKAYNAKANRGEANFSDADEAEAFGAYARLSIANITGKRYRDQREDENIVKTLTTTGLGTGEALVPGEFMASMIVNQEKYGVARQVCGVTPMSERTLTMPRLSGDVTISGVGEGSAMTATDTPTTNTVELVARKIGALVKVSSEFFNDSRIVVSTLVSDSVARSLGQAEDNAFFLGDGTSTYYGFYGVSPMLKGLSGTIANIAGLVVASGNLFSEFVSSDFDKVIGLLPQYADNPKATWVAHRYVAHSVMGRLGFAGGGNNVDNISGAWNKSFKGYPVTAAQVMPKVDANSQIAALFGDFSAAAKFGVVNNSLAFATSDHWKFDEDVTAIRVTERIAINVHDVGNAHATAASRVPGPVVGIISDAS